MYFFTSDEHYGHENRNGSGIIKYCHRPFKDMSDMIKCLIDNHNEVVSTSDTVIHAGDFSFLSPSRTTELIECLNGYHIFIQGSHDKSIKRLSKSGKIDYRGHRLELSINNKFIVIDHYCLRTWARSHYNSWHLFGHSHGRLEPIGKSWDIGVDNNNFYPVSFDQIVKIMETRPDNPNFIKKSNKGKRTNHEET
jgi:calcineurin-like phosphoesterase family protein